MSAFDSTSTSAVMHPGLLVPVDHDAAPFFDALRGGRLLVQRCRDCGAHRWPLRSLCPVCRSFTSDQLDAAGLGTVSSWTVARRAPSAELSAALPYAVALVTLDEQPDLVVPGNFVGGSEDLRIGAVVRMRTALVDDSYPVLQWIPVADTGS